MKICTRCDKKHTDPYKKYCQNCYKLVKHLQSPLIKCQCSENCKELIYSIGISGKKTFYKLGHNIGKAEKNRFWKGGKLYNRNGYIEVYNPDHPFANSLGYIKQHRLVYEEHYNCMLLPYVDIHHKNGIRDDNSIENLQPIYKKEHISFHKKGIKYIDMSNRYCLLCGSNTTRLNNKNNPMRIHYKNEIICHKCYCKLYRKKIIID